MHPARAHFYDRIWFVDFSGWAVDSGSKHLQFSDSRTYGSFGGQVRFVSICY